MPETCPTAENVHLSAVEHKDNIVFLHSVEPGPASQSYGLQVAKLAGVPANVIRVARKHLAELESHFMPGKGQLSLFSYTPSTEPEETTSEIFEQFSPVIEMLDELDPDSLSPREALEQLYSLKKQLKDLQ